MNVKGLVFIGLSALTLVACGNGTNATSSSESVKPTTTTSSVASESSSSAVATKKEYKIGDTIIFDKEVEITITEIYWTNERNPYVPEAEKVLVIAYDVKNLSDKKYSIGSEISCYVDGKKVNTHPVSKTSTGESISIERATGVTLSAGRAYDGAVKGFGINNTGPIELEIRPSYSFKTTPAIIKLDIQ